MPGIAGIRETEVGPSGIAQKERESNLSVACICCRAVDPAREAAVWFRNYATGKVPVEAIVGASHVFVLVCHLALAWLSFRRHAVWREKPYPLVR